MSQLTENTIIINKSDYSYEKLQVFLDNNGYYNSLKKLYTDEFGNILLTFDFNGSPTEYDDWPINNYMIETDYGDGEDLWTRCDFIEIDDTIQSQIQKGLLFPELHNNNELFNKIMHNLEYNIGGLHGDDLYELKPFDKLVDNLTSHQRELLLNAVNGFDNGDTAYYSSFEDLKEHITNNVLPIAYTTYGENEEHEIQVNFDFSKMCYQEYVNDELINDPNRIDRNFYTFCHELENCGFDDMIRACVHSLPGDELSMADEVSLLQNQNHTEIQGRDGLLEAHEKEVDMEYMDDNLLAKHNKLAEEIGVDEYIKTLWFMEQNDLTIDDVLDEKGNYKADLVSNYFKSHEEPTNDQWLKYLKVLGDNVSGFAEWLKDINKSKDGKDREFTNFKNRSMGK